MCILKGCCYAEIEIVVGDYDLVISECSSEYHIDNRVDIGGGICNSII